MDNNTISLSRLYQVVAWFSLVYAIIRLVWNLLTYFIPIFGDTYFGGTNSLVWLCAAGAFFVAHEVRLSRTGG